MAILIREFCSAQIGRRGSGAAGSGQTIPWSPEEERLLCAIVHEFGSNWFLVADVLAASCSMQGIYRSPHNCRQRFRAITVGASHCCTLGSFRGVHYGAHAPLGKQSFSTFVGHGHCAALGFGVVGIGNHLCSCHAVGACGLEKF